MQELIKAPQDGLAGEVARKANVDEETATGQQQERVVFEKEARAMGHGRASRIGTTSRLAGGPIISSRLVSPTAWSSPCPPPLDYCPIALGPPVAARRPCSLLLLLLHVLSMRCRITRRAGHRLHARPLPLGYTLRGSSRPMPVLFTGRAWPRNEDLRRDETTDRGVRRSPLGVCKS